MKKILSAFILSTCLCLSSVHVLAESTLGSEEPKTAVIEEMKMATFKDLKSSHWAYKHIQEGVKAGFIAGYPDGTFKPEQIVSNAEFMRMLVSGLGHDVPAKKEGQKWYSEFLNTAIGEEYLTKADGTNTKWDAQMTRTDVVNMSLSFLGKKPSNAKKSWYVATSMGLMVGMDAKGTLGENSKLTRAQSVTIVNRMIELKNGVKLEADKHAKSVAEVKYHRTNMFTFFSQYLDEREVDKVQESMFKKSFANGAYTTEAVGAYLIDLSDKNDPYRHLIAKGKLNGQPTSKLTSGFVQVIHYKLKATSNPLKLKMLDAMSASVQFGNQKGQQTVEMPRTAPTAISFSNATSGSVDYMYAKYYPQSIMKNPKSIEFSSTEPAYMGGKPTTHYLRYID